MSQQRTSSGSEQTGLSASPVTTASSLVSTVSLPGPTHTPSETPVIAGSLAGVIVLVVCLVTLLLLHKRRRQLRAERILRATQRYSSSQTFSGNRPHKRRSLNGYEERPPPRAQDSSSSSGSCAPSPSGVSTLARTPHHLHQLLNDNAPPDSTRQCNGPTGSNRNVHDPQDHDQSLALASIPIHQLGQSPSSGVRSPKPPLSPSQPHKTAKPVPRTQPPVNIPRMTSESSAPHGHPDEAVVDVALDNNNIVSASHNAIFSNTNRSDAGERRVTRQGHDGPKAGIPTVVAMRDVEREEARLGNEGGSRGPGRSTVGEPRPIAVSGVIIEARNGHGNEGGRSGTPGTSGGYNHLQGYMPGGEEDHSGGKQRVEMPKAYASVSESEYSHLAAGSGSGNNELAPENRIRESDGMEIASDSAVSTQPTSAIESGSSPPLSAHAISIPSASPPPPPLNIAGQYTRQRSRANQEITTNSNNTQLVSPARLGQNRSYLGHAQYIQAPIALSHLGAGPSAVEEDAPPAYENAWASAREAAAERRRAERLESRTL